MLQAYAAYEDVRVHTADPVELVQLSYRAAIEHVRRARRHLAQREVRERSDAITKAVEILVALFGALDHERCGELSGHLAALYDYMQRRLTDANIAQSEEPLLEVQGLLEELAQAWEQVEHRPAAAAAAPQPGHPPVWAEDTAMPRPALSWSA